MKITANVAKLKDTISIATRPIGGKTTMPVLACVLIEAIQGSQLVRITGTNLDLYVSASFPATVLDSGSVAIAGKRLQAVIGSLAGADAKISTDAKDSMSIACAPSKFHLLGLPANEFPPMNTEWAPIAQLKFTQAALAEILTSIAAAQSQDESRYTLNGIYINDTDKDTTFVGTDGRRLHVNTQAAQDDGLPGGTAILPWKAVAVLQSLLGDDGDVTIAWDARRLRATIAREDGDITVVSKLVEGSYPNYAQVLPKDKRLEIEIVTDDLIDALSRARLALDEKSLSVKIAFEGAMITVTAVGPSFGDASETVLCVNPGGFNGFFAANVVFLLDALRGLQTEKVTLRLPATGAEVSPIYFHNATVKTIVMPVRTS